MTREERDSIRGEGIKESTYLINYFCDYKYNIEVCGLGIYQKSFYPPIFLMVTRADSLEILFSIQDYPQVPYNGSQKACYGIHKILTFSGMYFEIHNTLTHETFKTKVNELRKRVNISLSDPIEKEQKKSG